MRITYDQRANALYVYVQENVRPSSGEQIDAGTLVDLDDAGRVVGIEVLNPAREWPVNEIVERFTLDLNVALQLSIVRAPQGLYPQVDATNGAERAVLVA